MQIMKLEDYLPIAWLSVDVHLVGIVPNLGIYQSKLESSNHNFQGFPESLSIYSSPLPTKRSSHPVCLMQASYMITDLYPSFVCYYLNEIFFLDN